MNNENLIKEIKILQDKIEEINNKLNIILPNQKNSASYYLTVEDLRTLKDFSIENQLKVMSDLLGYNECYIIFENGKYNISVNVCLQGQYSNDYQFIGIVKSSDIYNDSREREALHEAITTALERQIEILLQKERPYCNKKMLKAIINF